MVKNVGLLKFKKGNIATARNIGTVLYKSHTLLKTEDFDTCETLVVRFAIRSWFGQITVLLSIDSGDTMYSGIKCILINDELNW